MPEHLVDTLRAEVLVGLGAPGGALFGEGALFVFRVSGGEVGLLGEVDHLQPGRWASVFGAELGGQVRGLGLDVDPPRRPPGAQGGVDAVDLPYRTPAVAGGRATQRTSRVSR